MTTHRLRDVHPNPFRDLTRHPLNEAKLKGLRQSIQSTSFWDNIVARPRAGGGLELAYGHHRWQALIDEYGADHEVTFIVRDLDDGTMCKMMAAENREEWSHDFGQSLESVRATLQGFAEGKFDLPPVQPRTDPRNIRDLRAGAEVKKYTAESLTEFLGWDTRTIERCFAALDAEAEEIIEAEDLHGVAPTVAEEIVSVARETAKRESKPKARKKARELAEQSRRGSTSRSAIREMRRSMTAEPEKPPDINVWAERIVAKMGAFFFDDEFAEGLDKLVEFRDSVDEDTREQLAHELMLLAERAQKYALKFGSMTAIVTDVVVPDVLVIDGDAVELAEIV